MSKPALCACIWLVVNLSLPLSVLGQCEWPGAVSMQPGRAEERDEHELRRLATLQRHGKTKPPPPLLNTRYPPSIYLICTLISIS